VFDAALILHGTTGNSSNFLRADFVGELFGKGQLLDATQYYLIVPDNIGHGESSKSKGLLQGKRYLTVGARVPTTITSNADQ
jgi:homoserine O-acetyltransferase